MQSNRLEDCARRATVACALEPRPWLGVVGLPASSQLPHRGRRHQERGAPFIVDPNAATPSRGESYDRPDPARARFASLAAAGGIGTRQLPLGPHAAAALRSGDTSTPSDS